MYDIFKKIGVENMSEEMIVLYKKLNTIEKRNELSSLLIKLDELINQLVLKNKLYNLNFKSVKNFDPSTQVFDTEDEMLLFFYDDVWNIKTKILALLTNIQDEI